MLLTALQAFLIHLSLLLFKMVGNGGVPQKVAEVHGSKRRKSRGGAVRVRLEIDRLKRAHNLPAAENNAHASDGAADQQTAGKEHAVVAGSKEVPLTQPKGGKQGKPRADRQNAADRPSHPKAKRRKAEGFDGAVEAKQKDAKEARLATFATPTLGNPAKKKKRKAKVEPQQEQTAAEANLTKAQRKNLWRKRRREALRDGSAAA